MKKIIKLIIPSLLMIVSVYFLQSGKNILEGIYFGFPLMYILIGIISKDIKELIITLVLTSLSFLIPVNMWYNMGNCIDLVVIYNLLSVISYIIKMKTKKK